MPQRTENGQPSAQEQLRALYEDAESKATKAFEEAVGTPTFGALLARSAENVAAMTRIGSDLADMALRNLRVAGRADITRLAKQLHRTEDKLERVLQEVEHLRDELAASEATRARDATGSSGTSRTSRAQPASTGNGAGAARKPRRPRSS